MELMPALEYPRRRRLLSSVPAPTRCGRGEASLAALEAEHSDLTPTLTVLTGGGGRHLFFLAPAEELRNSAGKLGPGLAFAVMAATSWPHHRDTRPGFLIGGKRDWGHDLTVFPVLDDDERPIGVVTVDDILELLVPPPGRRFGIFGGS